MKEEKRQREEEEKRHREEEKRLKEEERRKEAEANGENLAKSPRKSSLKFSAEIVSEDEKERGEGVQEEEGKTRKFHRLSMTLSGFGNAEKRNARRSIALAKTPIPDPADATANH